MVQLLLISLFAPAEAGCRSMKETQDPVTGTWVRSLTAELSGGWSFRLASSGPKRIVRGSIVFPQETTKEPIAKGSEIEFLLDNGLRVTLGARDDAEAASQTQTELASLGLTAGVTTSYFSVYSPIYEASNRKFAALATDSLKAIRVQIGGRRHTRLLDGVDRAKLKRVAACFVE